MSVLDNYDQEKAVRFGDALKKSTDDRAGGSLGLAGGFGVGSASGRISAAAAAAAGKGLGGSRRAGAAAGTSESDAEITQSMLLADFERAKSLGRVLAKQVLAGQIDPVQEGKPIYMVGVFQEGEPPPPLLSLPLHSSWLSVQP
jgi:DNA-directed RNA polymerase-3 subunit RPC5